MFEKFREYLRDDRAAVAFETVILTPLLIWVYVGTFAFFDAYRVYNTSVKATYMVADMLSRQTSMQYPHDIQGMADVISTIIRGSSQVQMRATQVGMVAGVREVDWSWGVNGAAQLFTTTLDSVDEMLPIMPNGERVVLVETVVSYDAPFDVGLTVLRFENFTVVRPRYAGQVPFDPDETFVPSS